MYYSINVYTKTRTLYLYKNGVLIKKYPVAVGTPATPTPLGHWTITQKGLWGEQFGGHFMRLSIPKGIYGIHGTDMPESISKAVSHGCIRMFNNDAKELYDMVPIGTPVNVY